MVITGTKLANNNQRKQLANKKPNLINNEIKFSKFTLIDEEGKNLGEVARAYALDLANQKELDLVLINSNSNLVCKLMDYGKYLYEQKRKQRESKKNQMKVKIKEVKIKPQIGDNDLRWNAEHVNEWISNGDVVRILINTPGRLSTKDELIQDVYVKLMAMLTVPYNTRTVLKRISSFFYEAVIEPKKGK